LSKPREENNKESVFFFPEVHLKKVQSETTTDATSECTNTTRKDDPTWDLVA
jgi:hypothetical protein